MENIDVAVEEVAKSAITQADQTMDANEKVSNMAIELKNTVESIQGLNESCKKMKEYSNTAEGTMYELEGILKQTKESVQSVHQQTNITNNIIHIFMHFDEKHLFFSFFMLQYDNMKGGRSIPSNSLLQKSKTVNSA